MEAEKPKLSDWIQFLLSKKNRCTMLIIGDISALFVITSIIIFILSNLELLSGIIISIPVLIVFFYILYLTLNVFPKRKKSTNLLEDIMKEKITQVEKIKKIWFMEKKKMNKTKIKIIRLVSILIAAIILALIALFYFGLEEDTVIAALVGGALGAFWGLFLREIIGFKE